MSNKDGYTASELVAHLNECRALFGVFFTRLECNDENGEICDAFEDLMGTVINALHDDACCLKHFREGGDCEKEQLLIRLKKKIRKEPKELTDDE